MNHLSTSPESLCHPDYLGSIEWVTNADGRPVEYFWYSPWGETLQADNSWRGRFSSPFKFTGHIEDEETGLTYAGARYYPARESQWLSVDPMNVYRCWLTPYNYCQNNPVNLIDVDGKLDGIYVDENGEKIGWDGVHDDRYYMVSDRDVRKIKKNNKAGKSTPQSELKGDIYEIPSPEVRDLLFKKLIELSDQDRTREYRLRYNDRGYVMEKSNTEIEYTSEGLKGSHNLKNATRIDGKNFEFNLEVPERWGFDVHTHNYDLSLAPYLIDNKTGKVKLSLPTYDSDYTYITFRNGAVIDNNSRLIHFYKKGRPYNSKSMSFDAFFRY